MSAEDRIKELESNKLRMIDYLKLKLEEGDFHGVADAAMDIRDIEAALAELHTLH